MDKRHRVAAEDNLRHAFPELTDEGIERLVRRSFRHAFTMAVESVILVRKLRASTLDQYIQHLDRSGYQRVTDWTDSSRPVILMTGHIGNWEVLSFGMAVDNLRATVVARINISGCTDAGSTNPGPGTSDVSTPGRMRTARLATR